MNIMIVDDYIELAEAISNYLKLLGFQTVTYNSAISALKDHSFDLIISDYHMPTMDGIQLRENILESFQSLGNFIFKQTALELKLMRSNISIFSNFFIYPF